jgi:hypothetical protein
MTDNTERDNVLRRVQKLLAMANDGRGDPNEAAAAAQMAEKLMRKYQLDHADVIQQELKSKQGAVTRSSVFANMKRDDPKRPPLQKNPSWGQHLAVAVAKMNDCQVRQGMAHDKFGTHSACLNIFGYTADVQVACWMFDYLVGCTIEACKVFNAQRRKEGRADKAASEAFRKGFMTILTARIYALAQEKEAEQQAAVTSRALVISKQTAIVEAFGDFGYRQTKAKEVRNYGAYADGMRQARSVDLNNRGIGGTGASTLAIK